MSGNDYQACGVEKICPGCGKAFACDYERGAQCWCLSDSPSVAQEITRKAGCHCPACLKRKVAEAAGDRAPG